MYEDGGIRFVIMISLIATLIVLLLREKKQTYYKPPKYEQPEEYQTEQQTIKVEDYKQVYQPKWLFTYNEKPIFRQLASLAQRHNMICLAKVRLYDLVEPRKGQHISTRYKIQAKHVDFVLCTSSLVAKYIIELDDNSHKDADRKARDAFVDEVLTACGYKVLRIKGYNEPEIENFIRATQ